jgi:hypothetical protein
MRIVALITEAAPLERILTHIGEPAEPPPIAPARGPPAWDDALVDAAPDWDALGHPEPEYVLDPQVQPLARSTPPAWSVVDDALGCSGAPPPRP